MRGETGKPEVLHTLNGTAVTDRWVIALLENGQRDDGSVAVPEALVPYGAPSELRAVALNPRDRLVARAARCRTSSPGG